MEGVYLCNVTTSAGTGSDAFFLDVLFRPLVTINSSCNCINNQVIEQPINSSLMLSCMETRADPTRTFTWYRDEEDGPLINDSSIVISNISAEESQLTFSSIQPRHMGNYVCKANNTIGKDVQTITLNVLHGPEIDFSTPSTLQVPVGQSIELLLNLITGYPYPTSSWSRKTVGDANFVDIDIESNNRIVANNLGINISNATVLDAGIYKVIVRNDYGSNTREFDVKILVPPTLHPITHPILYRPTQSSITLEVNITNAQPPVNMSHIMWQGIHSQDRVTMTMHDSTARLEIRNLVTTDSGTIQLVVNHPAENRSVEFNLTVLNPPLAPLYTVNVIDTCAIEITLTLQAPDSNTAPTDVVIIEDQFCQSAPCNGEWNERRYLSHPILANKTVSLFMLPDQNYKFRIIGQSRLVGGGDPRVLPNNFSSVVEEYPRQVSNLVMNPINATSMLISWTPPVMTTKCYMILHYTISCTFGFHEVVPSIDGVDTYRRVLSGLLPDTEYTCSVGQHLRDMLGNVASLNATPATETAHTLPKPLDPSSKLNISKLDATKPGTIRISLDSVRTVSNVSHIRIYVLRLVSFTLPNGSPDTLYTQESDFSTYEAVHNGREEFKPYLAAEFDFQDIPSVFIIGDPDMEEEAKRQSDQPMNGPLHKDASYTAFIRAYSQSRFGRQFDIYTSSEFITPTRPAPVSDMVEMVFSSTTGVIIAVIVIVLVLAVITIIIVILLLMRRRLLLKTPRVNGGSDIPMKLPALDNDYYSVEDHLMTQEKPPLPPPNGSRISTPPSPNMAIRNPVFDSNSANETASEKQSPFEDISSESSSVRHLSLDDPQSDSGLAAEDVTMNVCTLPPSRSITRDEFQDHVDKCDDQKLFEKEFKSIIRHSKEYPAEATERANAQGKNRYRNITAFDRTRVRLTPVNGVENSDYINANFIKGYDEKKLYIATQGPKEETHCDFWRMIWERGTTTIVMLTNLEENGKLKCFQYWPNEGEKAYGDVVVRVDRNITLPSFSIRSFKLILASANDNEERTVIQFHYTAWPDKNVPAQATPVLDFLRAINSANTGDSSVGPIVVHCSAGVGRTGTIIALDICLDQLRTENKIDVRAAVGFLREQRTQMVQVLPQYIFIHHALLEDIVYGDTSVLLKNFPDHYSGLQNSECNIISNEFEKIGKVKPPAQASQGPDVVPGIYDDSFHAHYVDGYWYKRLFIVGACPSSENLTIFWQTVWREQCSNIINLTPKDSLVFKYLPESGNKKLIVDKLTITIDKISYMTGYVLRNITLTSADEPEKSLSLRHMHFHGWPSKHLPRVDHFVKFVQECIREADAPDRNSRPMLIHDDGTIGPSGVLTVLACCFQRSKKERLVDLLQCINRVHLQCPGLIKDLQMYAYCYDCLHEFTNKILKEESVPPIYENIASFRGRLQPSPEPITDTPVPPSANLNEYDIID